MIWTLTRKEKIRLALGAIGVPVVAAGLVYAGMIGLLPLFDLIDRSELASRIAWSWLLALVFALDAARLVLRCRTEDTKE